ncbi:DUF4410 domain-containing protein [Paraburkholderia sp. J12]|uniref:DUF4410 domain-containing protein n=1 Tax=Paraburkholderia sp. J12 TaxID=2805432 RepID=UPI002ABE0258|nr:DUF4410 domain-containing protein [Paraburkholderia sp. J12]
MKRRVFIVALVLWLSACGSVAVTSSTLSSGVQNNARPEKVYVADFELEGDAIQSEGPDSDIDRRALLARVFPDSPFMIHVTRQDRADHLASLMGSSIADDLKKDGLHVERLAPGAPRPSTGWLVRGQFLSVDEGDRMKRALIGFGAGHTNLKVRMYVSNLADSPAAQPMLDITMDARSGKVPGAALGFNPFLAAGGFVAAGADSDSDVKHVASKLSDEIAHHLLTGRQEIH